MALHALQSLTIGVPDPVRTAAFYAEFGLGSGTGHVFATADAGEQLRIQHSPYRRLLEMVIAADDPDDLERVRRSLDARGVVARLLGSSLYCVEPVTGTRVEVRVLPRLVQRRISPTAYNGPGRVERVNERAAVVNRAGPVVPRRLGHCVIGTPEPEALRRFFVEGLGFKVSDEVKDAAVFLRCSVDHHNLLIHQAPVNFLHHTSWQVDDADEVGRGAMRMLEADPSRHIWGFGRHCIGANFFWYLRDPAGNFAEYYSDMDTIVDDALWSPQVWEGHKGLYLWGPPPPPSFLHPEDLAGLMVGAHGST
ncbi:MULTISPECIES: VOC family protein [unclassified Streptosporangium]|uniref:VOC family protein n=1 Tax=unclassified Streptosporangium TaxID=2632669 RepID=UPI002E29F748|nr:MULTISPECIES: VOC family protein [unclassified Streptosporangium]